MNNVFLRTISTKTNTWCYRNGFYKYIINKDNDQYAQLICRFIDTPIVNKELAKKRVVTDPGDSGYEENDVVYHSNIKDLNLELNSATRIFCIFILNKGSIIMKRT